MLSLSVSCQTTKTWTAEDLVVTGESWSYPKNLTAAQARQDLDFLIYALSTGYGGRSYVPNQIFAQTLAGLKVLPPPVSVGQFHEQIDEALFQIPDNHLLAYYKGDVCKKRQALEKSGQVGANDISDPDKVWEARLDRVGKKRVLYVAIARFPDQEDEIWEGFTASIAEKMESSDAAVIDLRGNTGGDDGQGMELAQLLFGRPFEHPIKRQYRSQVPQTMALKLNSVIVNIANRKALGREVPEHILEELEDSRENFHRALRGDFSPQYIRTDKGTGKRDDPITGYIKPIYILMDGACGSSCEFTIAAFEWHKYVLRVGENTNGTFHFGNAGLVVLPNSHLKVMIPTQYSEYFDGRFIERVGFTPDIKVPPGQDAYETVKEILKK